MRTRGRSSAPFSPCGKRGEGQRAGVLKQHPGFCPTRLLPLLLALAALASSATAAEPVADKQADRWEPAIRAFEAKDARQPPAQNGIVFIGSSSIVGWDLKASFPDLPVINRGFGGSQLADSVRYAERIVIPYRPRIVVLYAGDNDLAAGKSPRQVADDFQAFVKKVHAALPETRIVYIAIKPSIKRWHLIEAIREANRRIAATVQADQRLVFIDLEPVMLGPDGKPRADLLKADGLHPNAACYKLWAELLRPYLEGVRDEG